MSVAMQWVLEAQLASELAAWVQIEPSSFFPPDAAEVGVDLAAFPVAALANATAAARAAEHFLRSGAFAVVVMDLSASGARERDLLSMASQSRLVGLAQKHAAALICLSQKNTEASSFGSLVSLRLHTHKKKLEGDHFCVGIDVLKDKRSGPGAHFEQVFHGPPGLR